MPHTITRPVCSPWFVIADTMRPPAALGKMPRGQMAPKRLQLPGGPRRSTIAARVNPVATISGLALFIMSASTAFTQPAVPAPETLAPKPGDSFDGPADVFAHWRGTALQYFAGAEFSIAEALATGLARGEVMHVPTDTEDRFGALAALVGEGSVWKDKGGRLREALAEFEAFLPLRRALVHGLARVETLSDGGFVVRMTLIDPFGRTGRETLFHDELEGDLEQLRDAIRTLRDVIRIHLASLPPVVEDEDD